MPPFAARRTITRWGLLPSFVERRRALPLPARLLIIGPVGLGDTVLALPALRQLQRASPATRVVWVGRAAHESVVRMAGIDGFVSAERLRLPAAQASAGGSPLAGADDAIAADEPDPTPLALDAFDAVITFGDVAASAFGRLGPPDAIPVRIGADNGLRRQWCNHLVHIKRLGFPRHEAMRNLRLLLPFGLPAPASSSEAGGLGRLSAVRATLPADLVVRGRHAVMHPFSAGHAREWPIDHWTRLATRLAADGIVTVFTGSAEDGALMQARWPRASRPAEVVDAFGRLDLAQLSTLLADASAVVACSTGPLHLAASLGAPAIGLFVPRKGLGVDRWAPLGAAASTLQAHRRCHFAGRCEPASCRCILDLGVEQVATAVHAAMAGEAGVDRSPAHRSLGDERSTA